MNVQAELGVHHQRKMQVDLPDYIKFSRVENNSISYLPEKPKEDQLHLFPNPAGDYVVAYFNTIKLGDKGIMVINDLQGRNFDNITLMSEQNQLVIDLSAYPDGIYLINLFVNDNLIATEKLSKALK
jgi:hypothetical protein